MQYYIIILCISQQLVLQFCVLYSNASTVDNSVKTESFTPYFMATSITYAHHWNM